MGYGLTDYHPRPAFSNNFICFGQYFLLFTWFINRIRSLLPNGVKLRYDAHCCFGSYYCLNCFVIMYDSMYSAKSIDTTYFLMLILMLCSRS